MVKKVALAVGFGIIGVAAAAQAIVTNQGSAPSGTAPATTLVAPAPGDGGDSGDKPCAHKCPSMKVAKQ